MAETFTCPSCSAPLEYEGGPMQKCKFCGSSVIAPSGLYKLSDLMGDVGTGNDPQFAFGGFSDLATQGAKLFEIQTLIQQGSTAQAVKLFHDTFGGDLENARKAVAALGRGEAVDLSGIQIVGSTSVAGAPRITVKTSKLSLAVFAVAILLVVGIAGVAIFNELASSFKTKSRTSANSETSPGGKPSTSPAEQSPVKELLKFGGEGNGAGRFDDNRTVAIDSSGNIYSADYSTGRLQIFNPDGSFKNQITLPPDSYVKSLAADRQGNLFALVSSSIYKFDVSTGKQTGKFPMSSANSLAVGLDGKLYVGIFGGGIAVLTADGARANLIEPAKELKLVQKSALAVDGAGNVYVAASMTEGVCKLSPTGVLIARFGGRSKNSGDESPSELDSVDGIAIDAEGRVFVSDVGSVKVFDGDGRFLHSFDASQSMGIAFDDKGDLFVAQRPYVVKYSVKAIK